ncbi:MAG: hypothetical protein K0U52_00605 [Gammaproteobacteria bacterium]|nr:hypothetical protein [Gammaproteobacteria bacterium]
MFSPHSLSKSPNNPLTLTDNENQTIVTCMIPGSPNLESLVTWFGSLFFCTLLVGIKHTWSTLKTFNHSKKMQLVFASENNGFLKALEKRFRYTPCQVGVNCPLVMHKTPNYLMSFLPGPLVRISRNDKLSLPQFVNLGNGYYHIQAPVNQLAFALLQLVHHFDLNNIMYVIIDAFGSIDTYTQRQNTAETMHQAYLNVFT